MCRAVAAADRRAAWARAVESLVAQSGRIRSVVITVDAFADNDIVRRRLVDMGDCRSTLLAVELMEDEEDMADAELAEGFVEAWLT